MDLGMIGVKIEKERKRMGLTLEKLSEMVGYNNYQTLRSIETGKRNITMSDLIKISKALGLKIDYFLSEEEKEEPVFVWRDVKVSEDNTIRKTYENELMQYIENYSLLLTLMGKKYPKYEVPSKVATLYQRIDNEYRFAEELAEWIREEYMNLGDYPRQELFQSLSDKGIVIFGKNLEKVGSAVSTVYTEKAGILINYADVPWRITFDIAHELFHLLTWNIYDYKNMTEENYAKIEKIANAFAANLLVPAGKIRELSKVYDNINDDFILKEAINFKVSIDALCSRLEFLNLLDSAKSNIYKSDGALKKQFYHLFNSKYLQEPYFVDVNNVKFPWEYFWNVWKTYIEGKLSKMKAAHLLNLNIAELDRVLKMNNMEVVNE